MDTPKWVLDMQEGVSRACAAHTARSGGAFRYVGPIWYREDPDHIYIRGTCYFQPPFKFDEWRDGDSIVSRQTRISRASIEESCLSPADFTSFAIPRVESLLVSLMQKIGRSPMTAGEVMDFGEQSFNGGPCEHILKNNISP